MRTPTVTVRAINPGDGPGGENISSIEVQQAIVAHPSVLEAAVIGAPHDYWGERPIALVTLKPDADATVEEIIDFCLERLAHYKCPVQKFVLRRECTAATAEPSG